VRFVYKAFYLRVLSCPLGCRDARTQAEKCSLTALRSQLAEFRDAQTTLKSGRIIKKGKSQHRESQIYNEPHPNS